MRDVPASARFYEALGFKRKVRATGDEIAFFEAGGVVLALWDWDKLAEDTVISSQPRPQTFRGVTLAWNCATPAEVDAAFAKAIAAGAGLLRRPEKTEYGGYRGYFADPDGHAWEVVQAPGFAFTDDGRLDPAGLAEVFPAILRRNCVPFDLRAPSAQDRPHESDRRCQNRKKSRAPAARRGRSSARRSAANAGRWRRVSGRSRAATRPDAARSRVRWWPPPSSSIRRASRAGSTIPRSSIAEERETLYAKICATAEVAVAFGSTDRIDRDNILRASLWALARAVRALPVRPRLVFVDGRDRIDCGCDCEAVISGDALVTSIAAASIVAKVTRDRLMTRLGLAHPGYGFERHMGYSVPEHFHALNRLGPTIHHRRSFAPVAAFYGETVVELSVTETALPLGTSEQ